MHPTTHQRHNNPSRTERAVQNVEPPRVPRRLHSVQEGWSPWHDPRSYPDEFRERAVRLVREWRAERGLSDGGLTVVAAQLGLHRETLRRRRSGGRSGTAGRRRTADRLSVADLSVAR